MKTRLGFVAVAAIAGCLSAPACTGPSVAPEGPDPRSIVWIDGSSSVHPITEAVAEEFRAAHPGARLAVASSGTGGGFRRFCAGETDVSGASRPIKPSEAATCARRGVEFVELPVAYDGLAVVVHPSNTWARAMTVAELRRVWEPDAQGALVRWRQIRSAWPDEEIRLFGPGVASGTFDFFTEAIVGREDLSRGDYAASEDDHVLVRGVAGDPLALGYFGFAYFEQNRDVLGLVAIDDERDGNGAGPIAPTVETVRDGTYQPLSRPVFIYVRADALDRPDVRDLASFYVDQAPRLTQAVGYIPLTSVEYDLVRTRLRDRVSGTMYGEGREGTLEERLRK